MILKFQKKRILDLKNQVLVGFSKKIPGIDQKWPKVSKTSKKSKIGGKSDFLEPNHGFSQMAKTSQINEIQRIRRFWRIFGQNKVGWSKNPKVPKMIPVVYIYVWESLGAKKSVLCEISRI